MQGNCYQALLTLKLETWILICVCFFLYLEKKMLLENEEKQLDVPLSRRLVSR